MTEQTSKKPFRKYWEESFTYIHSQGIKGRVGEKEDTVTTVRSDQARNRDAAL